MCFGFQTLVCPSLDPTQALLKFWQRLSLARDLVEVDTATLLQYNTIRAKEFLKLPPLPYDSDGGEKKVFEVLYHSVPVETLS